MGPHHDIAHGAPREPLQRTPEQMLSDDEIGLLDESLRLIGDRSDKVVAYFYAAMFVEAPQLRALFPAAMDTQRDRLFRALTGAVRGLADPDRLVPMLEQLGRDHRKYGVRAEHYDVLGRALIGSLRKHTEDVWVPELEAAWTKAYALMADIMQEGAREAATREPAWWKGDLVAHERRSDDLAVLLVRTDRPYDYEPGQYASIETTYRPRSWRTYSMATAPSADGLLEFHVRALANGWVSGPLVWRAPVGDQLRIGAPMGDMRIDQESRRDILMVAGGTGLAPVKAMVDGMARWNTARSVTLLFGARRAGDLYDMGPLHRLAAVNAWLTVVPVVSEDPSFNGEQGLLPDAVARRGSWSDHDVFVSGSPAMTRAPVARLMTLGVPADRLRFDVAEGQHPATAQVIDLRRTRASRAAR
jgi:NAD(P)H-flavin reductase/hemoglobin-like flavoprotein